MNTNCDCAGFCRDCGREHALPAEPALPEDIPPLPEPREETPDWKPKKLPLC